MTELNVDNKKISSNGVNLNIDDYGGNGRPVVLIHGWPLSGKSWGEQIQSLIGAGYRVITYDRRGFGDSDKPSDGYDYDTFATDLNVILEEMDLSGATLVGFSMGGGEVARYITKYGEEKLHSVVFAAAVPPYMAKIDNNPDGPLDDATADEMSSSLEADDSAFYKGFMEQFFSANGDGKSLVSDSQMADAIALTSKADKTAALGAMNAFATTDFRQDLQKVTIPTLVIHGSADAIVPFDNSGKLTHQQVNGSELHIVEGGPHGMNVSHADEFNQVLIEFLGK